MVCAADDKSSWWYAQLINKKTSTEQFSKYTTVAIIKYYKQENLGNFFWGKTQRQRSIFSPDMKETSVYISYCTDAVKLL